MRSPVYLTMRQRGIAPVRVDGPARSRALSSHDDGESLLVRGLERLCHYAPTQATRPYSTFPPATITCLPGRWKPSARRPQNGRTTSRRTCGGRMTMPGASRRRSTSIRRTLAVTTPASMRSSPWGGRGAADQPCDRSRLPQRSPEPVRVGNASTRSTPRASS
jgi:hypothetical protein